MWALISDNKIGYFFTSLSLLPFSLSISIQKATRLHMSWHSKVIFIGVLFSFKGGLFRTYILLTNKKKLLPIPWGLLPIRSFTCFFCFSEEFFYLQLFFLGENKEHTIETHPETDFVLVQWRPSMIKKKHVNKYLI